jgi:hypothetical protein
MKMSDQKKSNWDCYLRGVSTANVAPGKLISGIKGAGDRADAVRRDAFEGSPTPLSERVDRRR